MVSVRAGKLTGVVAAGIAATFLLAGCTSNGAESPSPATEPAPSPPATAVECLAGLNSKPIVVDGIYVQVIGSSENAVVISNQRANLACPWVGLAKTLSEHGYQVVLYEYTGDASKNAETVYQYVASHGASSVTLLGASEGGKASIIAATEVSPAPTALVVLSAGEYLNGENVVSFAAKVASPTLYLTAEHDPGGSMSASQKFQDSTPGGLSTLTVIPGRDHGVQLLPLPGVTDSIVAFLDAHVSM